MFASWIHDLRLAVRGVGRAKGFYSAAVLTLAIGMAGATVMFTLVRGILLRPLPVPDEDRLVVSWRVAREGPTHVPYRAGDVEEIARASRLFAGVAGVGYNGAWDYVWADGDTAFTLRTAVVMGSFFDVTRATPVLGRALTADDDREGAEPVVVLSHAAWQRMFGGAADVVGRRLAARSQPFVVVGVMPPDFEYPPGVELWTSRWAMAGTEENPEFRTALLRDVEIVARLRPEVTLAQSAAELATLAAELDTRSPDGFVSLPAGRAALQGRRRRRRRPGPGDPLRRRGCAAGHRRGQRRQLAADARRSAPRRVRGAGGARGEPRPDRAAALHREPGGDGLFGGGRPGRDDVVPAGRDDARAGRPAEAGVDPCRRRGDRVHERGRVRRGHTRRAGAGAGGFVPRPGDRAARRRPRRSRRDGSARTARPGRDPGGARRGRGRRGGAIGAQPASACRPPTWDWRTSAWCSPSSMCPPPPSARESDGASSWRR